MNGWASVKGLTTAALVLAISGCGGAENKPGNAQRDQRRSIAVAEKVVILEEFVSKTPGAKLYPQPARDLKINWKNINNEMALVDTVTGDAILSQDADRERRILYFAYVTKDRELVRIFSTQWGGGSGNYILDFTQVYNCRGSYGRRWRIFPIRVYDVEEAKKITPSVKEARKRATLERFALFLSSWPDFEGRAGQFLVIDAPISKVYPL